MPSISSEPDDQPLQNLFLCSSNFVDEQYLSLFVCGFHHLIVDLMFLQPMNVPSCVLFYKVLVNYVMEYISHPNVLSS